MAISNTEYILCNYYLKKTIYSNNKLISFFTASRDINKNVKNLVSNFNADENFNDHFLDFKRNLNEYIPIFEDNPGQRTLFMEELSSIFKDQNYIKTDSQVFESLGLLILPYKHYV